VQKFVPGVFGLAAVVYMYMLKLADMHPSGAKL
jgi:hypothetical protein